ncbi:MAG: RidA family protein [Bacteroidetes bacterium]|nr:RidA family protein [Bacteroidota bacterium]
MKTIITTAFIFSFFLASAQKIDFDKKLKDLGVELYQPTQPMANYAKVVRSDNLLFFSGHGPTFADNTNITGKVGKDLNLEQGYKAARQTGIALLSSLKAEVGDLNKVKRIVKVLGMVNSAEGFAEQHKVMNGFSDLMVAVFGEKGKHARSSVGMYMLPTNISVEIEMIVEVEE